MCCPGRVLVRVPFAGHVFLPCGVPWSWFLLNNERDKRRRIQNGQFLCDKQRQPFLKVTAKARLYMPMKRNFLLAYSKEVSK